MIVLGTQLGLFSMTRGNLEHQMAKWEQFQFGRLSREAVSIYSTVFI